MHVLPHGAILWRFAAVSICGVENRKRFMKRPSGAVFHRFLYLGKFHGGDIILKFAEFVNELRRDQIRPETHDLAELDKRRTQIFHCEADSFIGVQFVIHLVYLFNHLKVALRIGLCLKKPVLTGDLTITWPLGAANTMQFVDPPAAHPRFDLESLI
jgi:hypothetical protein